MEQRAAGQFLGLPSPGREAADARVLPLPLEATVSYGRGTAGGPQAILEASQQIELFDEETLVDFTVYPKLHTLPPLAATGGVEDYLAAVRQQVAALGDRFLMSLGGEHTITYGTVRGLVGDPSRVTVVQIDAHADLADRLEGRRWSHGTVMRRLWEEGCRLVQIGIRSLSRSEYELSQSGPRIVTWYAHRLAEQWEQILAMVGGLEGKVYLTIDVDGLDPAVIPSTGTPQPNGLSWRQMMALLERLAAARKADWIGADVVELVPSPQPPGCDFTAARLVQKVLAHWARGRQGERAT